MSELLEAIRRKKWDWVELIIQQSDFDPETAIAHLIDADSFIGVKLVMPLLSQQELNNALNYAVIKNRKLLVDLFLLQKEITPKGINSAIETALYRNLEDIFIDLFLDDRAEIKSQLLTRVINLGWKEATNLLLDDSRLTSIHPDSAIAAINGSFLDILQRILSDPRFERTIIDQLFNQTYDHPHYQKSRMKLFLEQPELTPESVYEAMMDFIDQGETEIVEMILGDPRSDPTKNNQHALRLAIQHRDYPMVRTLLQDSRVDPRINPHSLMIIASEEGDDEIYYLVQNQVNLAHPYFLYLAGLNGHTKMFRRFLSHHDLKKMTFPKNWNRLEPDTIPNMLMEVIMYASSDCYIEIFKIIYPFVEPTMNQNILIRNAIRYNCFPIFSVIMNDSRFDPSSMDNAAIRVAAKKQNKRIIKILMTDPRVFAKLVIDPIPGIKIEKYVKMLGEVVPFFSELIPDFLDPTSLRFKSLQRSLKNIVSSN